MMREKSKWAMRQVKCCDTQEATSMVLEWRVKKGKKILHSVSCNHPRLLHYSGEDCSWQCLERISGSR